MKIFKIEVSKWLKKFNLIKKSESESLLRQELHKEGFSILSVNEIEESEISWNKFYFEIIQNWNLKTWTIISNDAFKAFLKITIDLKYNLKYLYQNKDTTIEEKENIIKDLKEQYKLYLESNKKEIQQKKLQQNIKIKQVEEVSVDSFWMKKELEEVYKIIEKVLIKLNYFLQLKDSKYLSFKKKEKLQIIYNIIIQIKNSTNITKLKSIWELALKKVWEIELCILEDTKDIESKKILKETNSLLKQIWSKQFFIEKDKDIWYILKNLYQKINEFFINLKQIKKSKKEIDTTSTIYLKTKLLYEKYNNKLKELNKKILINFYVFLIPTNKNIEKKEGLLLRKKVLKQNMFIFKSRLEQKNFSYSKIIKWYNYFVEKIINILNLFIKSLLLIVIFYDLLFLSLYIIYYFWVLDININFYWLFYFILLNLFLLLMNFIKWLISLIFSIVILNFIFILWVINF